MGQAINRLGKPLAEGAVKISVCIADAFGIDLKGLVDAIMSVKYHCKTEPKVLLCIGAVIRLIVFLILTIITVVITIINFASLVKNIGKMLIFCLYIAARILTCPLTGFVVDSIFCIFSDA